MCLCWEENSKKRPSIKEAYAMLPGSEVGEEKDREISEKSMDNEGSYTKFLYKDEQISTSSSENESSVYKISDTKKNDSFTYNLAEYQTNSIENV